MVPSRAEVNNLVQVVWSRALEDADDQRPFISLLTGEPREVQRPNNVISFSIDLLNQIPADMVRPFLSQRMRRHPRYDFHAFGNLEAVERRIRVTVAPGGGPSKAARGSRALRRRFGLGGGLGMRACAWLVDSVLPAKDLPMPRQQLAENPDRPTYQLS